MPLTILMRMEGTIMSKLSIKSILKLISKRPNATKTRKMQNLEKVSQATRNSIHAAYYEDPNAKILPTTLKDLTQQIKDYGDLIDKKIDLALEVRDSYKELKKVEETKIKINNDIDKNLTSNTELSELTDNLTAFMDPFNDVKDKLGSVKETEKNALKYVKILVRELEKAKELKESASVLRKDLEEVTKLTEQFDTIKNDAKNASGNNAKNNEGQKVDEKDKNNKKSLSKTLIPVTKLLNLKTKLNGDIIAYDNAVTAEQKSISNAPYSSESNLSIKNLALSEDGLKLEKKIKEILKRMNRVFKLNDELEKVSKKGEDIVQSIDTSSYEFNKINANIMAGMKSKWLLPDDFRRYLDILNREL